MLKIVFDTSYFTKLDAYGRMKKDILEHLPKDENIVLSEEKRPDFLELCIGEATGNDVEYVVESWFTCRDLPHNK